MKASVLSNPMEQDQYEHQQNMIASKLANNEPLVEEENPRPSQPKSNKQKQKEQKKQSGKLQKKESAKPKKEDLALKSVDPSSINLLDAGWLKTALFGHVTKVIDAGSKEFYTEDMLYKLDSRFLHDDFDKFFAFFQKNREKYKDDFLGLVFAYNRYYISLGTWVYNTRHFIELTFPWILKEILIWLGDKDSETSRGLYLGGSLCLLVILRAWFGIIGSYTLTMACGAIRSNIRVIFFIYNYP